MWPLFLHHHVEDTKNTPDQYKSPFWQNSELLLFVIGRQYSSINGGGIVLALLETVELWDSYVYISEIEWS